MAALTAAHARTVARFPRPHLDGAVLTWTDLAAGPDGCPDVPCAQQSRFTPAERRIIAESLWLRTEGAEGRRSYRNPLARRRDTLAFLDITIEAALALPAES